MMPLIPYVKQTMAMPNKPGFYQYCTFLLILYIVRFIGAAFIFFEANPNGLCLVNLTTFLYLTFYSPFVYSAFLSPFFRTAQPTLLFSYKVKIAIQISYFCPFITAYLANFSDKNCDIS